MARVHSWNNVVQVITLSLGSKMETFPDESPAKQLSFADPTWTQPAAQPKRLPLHPTLVKGLETLARKVEKPVPKAKTMTSTTLGPLTRGQFLEPECKLDKRLFTPCQPHKDWTSAAKVKHDLACLCHGSLGHLRTSPTTEKESLFLLEICHWGHTPFVTWALSFHMSPTNISK